MKCIQIQTGINLVFCWKQVTVSTSLFHCSHGDSEAVMEILLASAYLLVKILLLKLDIYMVKLIYSTAILTYIISDIADFTWWSIMITELFITILKKISWWGSPNDNICMAKWAWKYTFDKQVQVLFHSSQTSDWTYIYYQS